MQTQFESQVKHLINLILTSKIISYISLHDYPFNWQHNNKKNENPV